jgi:hypothetical protein
MNGRLNRLGATLLLAGLVGCSHPSRLEDVFSDLSIGVPGYQRVESFMHPAEPFKGDFFSLEFTQTAAQFGSFIARLSVAETNVLSPAGVSDVTVPSKTNPRCPWFFSLKAKTLKGPQTTYRVHVEGRQPYD